MAHKKKTHCVYAGSKKGSKKISCHATHAKAIAAARARRKSGKKGVVKTRVAK